MLNIGRWLIALICAAPGAFAVVSLVQDGKGLSWPIDISIGCAGVLHLAAGYGLLRWRNWGRWTAIPALGIFYLGAWSSLFEDKEYLEGGLLLAAGLMITVWLLLPAVRARFAQEKASA